MVAVSVYYGEKILEKLNFLLQLARFTLLWVMVTPEH